MREWQPSAILSFTEPVRPHALIILNQNINRVDILKKIWAGATYRFCADGGANRLYDIFKDDAESRAKFLPNVIHGDLDSLRTDVREYYNSQGVSITQDHDQYSTDFMKCIALLRKTEAEAASKNANSNSDQLPKKNDIVAFPALGGRFDQTIASINQLYFMKDEADRQLLLVSDENLTILLDKGKHRIKCNREIEGPTCGVMPLGGPVRLTTRGLKWNLTDFPCHFGGMVSTSNLLDSDTIEIETDEAVVWTVELKEDLS
ncbi:thiamine pyrophosphokinase [Umbelopsis sp. WA50703]